jgi:hypothetical protein
MGELFHVPVRASCERTFPLTGLEFQNMESKSL